MIFLGIDIGLSGALAFYNNQNDALDVIDMPTLDRGKKDGGSAREVDAVALADILDMRHVDCAVIERVQAIRGDGAVGAFKFGLCAGVVIGVVATRRIPATFVRPAEWKKALRLNRDKDASRAMASEVYPRHAHLWARKKDDGRAEAALLVHWLQRSGGSND